MQNEVNGVRDSGLRWLNEDTGQWVQIDENILSISCSFTMDMCSQLTVQVLDPAFKYMANNFFWITRTVAYKGRTLVGAAEIPREGFKFDPDYMINIFEIASAQMSPGAGTSPVWTLELRTKPIQQMKRDKNPSRFKGSGNAWVASVAKEYGLEVLMENTSKTQQIEKASGDRVADSVWDVLQRLASESDFVCFETNGTLVFASQRFLIGMYGDIFSSVPFVDPQTNSLGLRSMNYFLVRWPSTQSDTVIAMSMPSIRQSDNDPLEATGSVTVDRYNGVSLRPGMTVGLAIFADLPGRGFGGFSINKLYLIDSVNYDHFGRNPVSVSFRTPEREEKYIQQYEVGRIFNPRTSSDVMKWY
jgi:hypothetical protein